MNPDTAAGLLLASAGFTCGAGTLLAMRRFSDQPSLRLAKSRVRAHLYEMRLFGDDPVLALRAQKKLLVWNLRYVRLALLPAAIVFVPALLLLSQMDALFGHQPLAPGESTTVTVQFKGAAVPAALAASPSFAVESPPLRIGELRQVCWRIRALGPSDGALRLSVARENLQRPIHAGAGLRLVTPTCSSGATAFVRYGCRLQSECVESIAVDYPSREIALFGFEAHWLLWLALFWLATMFMFKRRFGVTF